MFRLLLLLCAGSLGLIVLGAGTAGLFWLSLLGLAILFGAGAGALAAYRPERPAAWHQDRRHARI